MKWYEYLEMKCQNFYEILNELFLQYHTYLDDKIINKIIKAKILTSLIYLWEMVIH